MSDEPSVTDLMARARNRDKHARDTLVERYAPLIWSICRRHRRRLDGVDDVGQSVWLQPVDQLDKVRDPAARPGWLATTTGGNAHGSYALCTDRTLPGMHKMPRPSPTTRLGWPNSSYSWRSTRRGCAR